MYVKVDNTGISVFLIKRQIQNNLKGFKTPSFKDTAKTKMKR